MGAASSIENAQFDATKFKESKAIMDSSIDDAEKFAKLKHIWTEAQAAAAAQDASKSASGPSAPDTTHAAPAKLEEHANAAAADHDTAKHDCHSDSHKEKPATEHDAKSEEHTKADEHAKKEHPKTDDHAKKEEHLKTEAHAKKDEHAEAAKPTADAHAATEHPKADAHAAEPTTAVKEEAHAPKTDAHPAKEDGHATKAGDHAKTDDHHAK